MASHNTRYIHTDGLAACKNNRSGQSVGFFPPFLNQIHILEQLDKH